MTHYDILGVARNADQVAIRKGYLRASLRCHPDKNPGREEEAKAEFVEVGQAASSATPRSGRRTIANWPLAVTKAGRDRKGRDRGRDRKHKWEGNRPKTTTRTSTTS